MPSWITLIAAAFTISWIAIAAMVLHQKTLLMRCIRAELPPDVTASKTGSWRDVWIHARMADEVSRTSAWAKLASRLEAEWGTARRSVLVTACVTGGCLAVDIIMIIIAAGPATP